jgi:hypothetical protein
VIWVTWRQHRSQLLTIAAVLAVSALVLWITGTGIASTFRTTGLSACLASPGRDCSALQDALTSRYAHLQNLIPLFLILPGMVGVFLGAPLVARELEQGTHRLAWTQSITRGRWIGVKLAVLGGATVVGSALFTLILTWWSRPLVAASGSALTPGPFDLRGIVPVAYALFALALGLFFGVVLKRTVAAMASTIGGYVAVRTAVVVWLRPHFAAPATLSYAGLGSGPAGGYGDWVLSTKTVDAAGRLIANGHGLDIGALATKCPG